MIDDINDVIASKNNNNKILQNKTFTLSEKLSNKLIYSL